MRLLFLFVLLLFVAIGCASHEAAIDFTCSTAADCTIKDVGNACGYYPLCVNKAFAPTPPMLFSNLCGFPSINRCDCVQDRCEGFLNNSILTE